MSIIGIGILAIAGYCLLGKRKQPESIGKLKRNIYKEISELQQLGIDLSVTYDELTSDQRKNVEFVARKNHYKQGNSARPYAEAFYRSVRSQYRRIVGSVGYIDYPHTEYAIRNQRGDVVLTYNHYDEDADLKAAEDMFTQNVSNDDAAYFATIIYIANGGKFVWKSKIDRDGNIILAGVEDELFGTTGGRRSHPQEKKSFQKIIASLDKGGMYPVQFAESLSLDHRVLDGVLDAIRDAHSSNEAKDILLNNYYQQFQREDIPEYDIPF